MVRLRAARTDATDCCCCCRRRCYPCCNKHVDVASVKGTGMMKQSCARCPSVWFKVEVEVEVEVISYGAAARAVYAPQLCVGVFWRVVDLLSTRTSRQPFCLGVCCTG